MEEKLQQPLISIVVPAYNAEQTLNSLVEGIQKQTYSNWEMIIVDDGSKDNTLSLANELANSDARIRVIHQENKGLSGARNTGIDHMKGDYVTFLDADDFLQPQMFEAMLLNAKTYDADYISSDLYFYGEDSPELGEYDNLLGEEISKSTAIGKLFDKIGYTSACAKLYRVTLWKELRYPEDIRFSEDMYIAHLLIDQATKIVHLKQYFYYYDVRNQGSLTRSDFQEKKMHTIYASELWVRFCDEKYPEMRQKAHGYYMSVVISYLSQFAQAKRWDLYKSYRKLLRKNMGACVKNRTMSKDLRMKSIFFSFVPMKLFGFLRSKMS